MLSNTNIIIICIIIGCLILSFFCDRWRRHRAMELARLTTSTGTNQYIVTPIPIVTYTQPPPYAYNPYVPSPIPLEHQQPKGYIPQYYNPQNYNSV